MTPQNASYHMPVRVLPWLLLLCAAPAFAADWPQWRGPRGDGVSEETNLPIRWSDTTNVAWKAAVPGKGHSSPIVCGGRVFITTALEKEQKRLLLCFDARDGKPLWERVVLAAPLERKHNLNSYASSTPAAAGGRVFTAFLDRDQVQVACFDFAGNPVWQRSPGKFSSMHGFCSSPVLHKDLVIVNADHDGDGYVVALDQATGQERWRIDRPNKTRSYGAPFITAAAGRTQMVMAGSKCTASYDPETGKLHWIIDGPTEQFVASLVFADDVFFLTAGFPTFHLMGIKPDGNGNVTGSHVLWHHAKLPAREAAYVPSPIAVGKHFFVVSDLGLLTCLEARTGKRLWMEKLGKHHSASPVLAGGHLYFLDDAGVTFVLKAGPTFEVVSKNELNEECYASPAVSDGRLFIRGLRNLYCIGAAQSAAP
jgi:outer membrane protein assembly factor BamB